MQKGFRVLEARRVAELNCDAILLEHEKTGARILKLKNDDMNRTFSITFETIQHDSTGICHILEHSVLSGSRKYKTKEPFMDLIKNSLQTFLNAMTFDDRTMYPVSSRNPKDFYNLMDVYLDAVFYPAIYEEPKIFAQEGWHFELESPDAPLRINGVVYNEMKGAMSSDYSQVSQLVSEYRNQGSTYCTNSGGDPEVIPQLRREALLEYHRTHYHPSNSYIFLYGDGDTDEELAHLAEFLDLFDRIEPLRDRRPIQDLSEDMRVEVTYAGEEKDKNDMFVVSFLCGDIRSREDALIHSIIVKYLLTEEGAPIRDRLQKEGLADDVMTLYSESDRLNFGVFAKGMHAKDREAISSIVLEELSKLAQEGMDSDELKALIRQARYDFRTFDNTPLKGVLLGIHIMQSWMYGADPIQSIELDSAFRDLEEHPEKIQAYVKRYLQGPHFELLARPDAKLSSRREKALEEKLAAYKKDLSAEDIERIVEDTRLLHEFQLREDSPEQKATIPTLSREDLSGEVTPSSLVRDGNFFMSPMFTEGYVYLGMYSYLPHMTPQEARRLAVVGSLITTVDSKKRTYREINTAINALAYDFDVHFSVEKIGDTEENIFLFGRQLSADPETFDDAFALFEEVHLESLFDDVSRLREVLRTKLSKEVLNAVTGGIQVTSLCAMAHREPIAEALGGPSMILYLRELLAMDDAKLLDEIREGYAAFCHFFREPALYHVAGERAHIDLVRACLERRGKLGFIPERRSFAPEDGLAEPTAILATTEVNYCCDVLRFPEVSGSDVVASHLLSLEYLHNRIRAKGGAYGDGIRLNRGYATLYSYRDPNLSKTQEVFEGAADWLDAQSVDEAAITNLVIGSYNVFEPHLTPKLQAQRDMILYLRGVEDEVRNRRLSEALRTRPEDIRAFAQKLRDGARERGRAVLTSESTYEQERDRFARTVDIR